MNKNININKKIVMFLFALCSLIFIPTAKVYAWGPERSTYTMKDPAHSATFNSITDNAAVGDERDFVRVVEVSEDGTKKTYANEVEVVAGKTYQVYIYYHNDASETFDDKAHDYVGVAMNTRVSSNYPLKLAAGEKGEIYGAISSTTTSPEKVWDSAYLNAKEDVTLHYIAASATLHNDWKADGSVLSTNLFSEKGTFIGLNELEGTILGCDKYSGYVVYRIVAEAASTPISYYIITISIAVVAVIIIITLFYRSLRKKNRKNYK